MVLAVKPQALREDIHCFRVDQFNLVLDVNSGSLHLLDDLAADVLSVLIETEGSPPRAKEKLGSRYSPEEIDRVLEEIETLVEEGTLLTEASGSGSYEVPASPLKALCLHVAHDCNLRCRYCFGDRGAFGGPRGLMSLDVGERALDFLIKESGERRQLEVDFFGGEPLLNFPVVEQLVAYGQSRARAAGKNINFTLTTNGLLLTSEVGNFLNRHGIQVILSLDGRPEVNDNMRVSPEGAGSYARVLPRIKQFVASREGCNYYVRGTYTAFNLDFSRDALHLVDQGFRRISLEPAVSGEGVEYALRPEQLPLLRRQYQLLARSYWESRQKGEPFEFFHFNLDLLRGPCLPKRLSGCGAGYAYLAVTPEGDLYPCHQLVGRDSLRMGHVNTGLERQDLADTFRRAHVGAKEECRRCWARFYCSGGCHASALQRTGDLLQPDTLACELMRCRLEMALYLEARKATEEKMH